MTKLYTYSSAHRMSVKACTGVLGALFVWTIVQEELNLDALLGFGLLGILGVGVLLGLNGTLQLDEKGIHYLGWRRESVKWSEITDVTISPHKLSISTAHRNGPINLTHGEYAGVGIGFEPFEDLCQEVTHHTLPRLSQIWAQQGLPLVCRYPGITRPIMLAYAVPILFVMTFFILFMVKTDGMLLEKILFLFLGLLAIVPFWLRDYRRNCNTLMVTADGIKQTHGQHTILAWADIREIILTEEPLGFDSIIVKGHGGSEIRIPRSLPKCGAILYWLKRYTNLSETSYHEMTVQG